MAAAAPAPAAVTARDAKRARYLYAAMQCIRRLGLNETTMDDIAARAGVKRVTLYREFGGRPQLIRAVMSHRNESFNRRFIARMGHVAELDRFLEDYLLDAMRIAISSPFTRELIQGRLDFTRPGQPLHDVALAMWRVALSPPRKPGAAVARLDPSAAAQWILIGQFLLCRLALDGAIPRTAEGARPFAREFILAPFLRGEPPRGVRDQNVHRARTP